MTTPKMPLFRRLTATALAAWLVPASLAHAADCQQPDALGVARTMTVDPHVFQEVGSKSFTQSLPLADKEVVLTFDDGPFPPTTKRVLAALAAECAKATFFLIGRNAEANQLIVRSIAAAGHTVGYHSWSHPMLDKMAPAAALRDIDRGIAAVDTALGSPATETRAAPFFRFPYFVSTPALLETLKSRGMTIFGADLWASDWNEQTPEHQLQLIARRLDHERKGIILFHDTKRQTAAMLPAFLRYLKSHNYRLVHVTPLPKSREKASD